MFDQTWVGVSFVESIHIHFIPYLYRSGNLQHCGPLVSSSLMVVEYYTTFKHVCWVTSHWRRVTTLHFLQIPATSTSLEDIAALEEDIKAIEMFMFLLKMAVSLYLGTIILYCRGEKRTAPATRGAKKKKSEHSQVPCSIWHMPNSLSQVRKPVRNETSCGLVNVQFNNHQWVPNRLHLSVGQIRLSRLGGHHDLFPASTRTGKYSHFMPFLEMAWDVFFTRSVVVHSLLHLSLQVFTSRHPPEKNPWELGPGLSRLFGGLWSSSLGACKAKTWNSTDQHWPGNKTYTTWWCFIILMFWDQDGPSESSTNCQRSTTKVVLPLWVWRFRGLYFEAPPLTCTVKSVHPSHAILCHDFWEVSFVGAPKHENVILMDS